MPIPEFYEIFCCLHYLMYDFMYAFDKIVKINFTNFFSFFEKFNFSQKNEYPVCTSANKYCKHLAPNFLGRDI